MKRFFLTAIFAVLSASSASAATLYFDFGSSASPTPGNYNNVDHTQAPILNAIDSTGAATGIGLAAGGFNEIGPNTSGTTTPSGAAAAFQPEATRDSLFGHSDNFNAGSPRPLGVLSLTGLDGSGATSYSFTFFASRTGVTDNRETAYAVTGANSNTAYLNASSNVSNVAIAAGIVPTATGTISINVNAGPNNSNGSKFFYLGAMSIESRAIPEPAGAALVMLAIAGFAAARPSLRRGLVS